MMSDLQSGPAHSLYFMGTKWIDLWDCVHDNSHRRGREGGREEEGGGETEPHRQWNMEWSQAGSLIRSDLFDCEDVPTQFKIFFFPPSAD